MQEKTLDSQILSTLKEMEKRMEFIEEDVVTIKSWLSDDEKLTLYEKKLMDESIRKVKSGRVASLPTLNEMRKRAGV